MASITYPDDETVTYGYDAGGLVTKVSGGKSGIPIDYVEKIGYDKYGQRVYMKYGNGVETQYSYDPERRWLKRIEETSATQEILQNASYTFDKVGNVLTIDDTSRYRTTNKQYEYDTLNQLTSAVQGYSAKLSGEAPKSSNLEQIFRYDTIGNLTYKGSTDVTRPDPSSGARLTYALGYSYDAIHPHRANRVGDFYYRYDDNGNLLSMTTAQTGTEATWGTSGAGGTTSVSGATGSTSGGIPLPSGTGYAMSAFGADRASSSGSTSSSGTGSSSGTTSSQNRQYSWDEENRLTEAKYPGKDVRYSYDASGERRVKWTTDRETYYIDKLVQTETSAKEPMMTKHIFLGSTRIATVVTYELAGYAGFEKENRFWYGSDHIGSTTVVTDWQGEEYERLDYTPYGETWVEETKDVLERLNYQFSGKELDRETGLYYYGARYFDPRTSLWISADPALGDYFAVAPTDDDAKKHNENLPGMGGVFNPVNLALYHYAGNNPVKYTDPDGKATNSIPSWLKMPTQAPMATVKMPIIDRLLAAAAKYSGYTYQMGARIDDQGKSYQHETPDVKLDSKVVDCSGLVARVYKDVFGADGLEDLTSQTQPDLYAKSEKAIVGGLMSFKRTSDGDPHIAVVTAVDKDGKPTRVLESVGEYTNSKGETFNGVTEHEIPSNYLDYNPIYTKPPEE